MTQDEAMRLFCCGWTLAKAGNPPEENEDAYRIECLLDETGARTLLAISDGATEAVYSRRWARTLVEAAAADWPCLHAEDLSERLDCVRKQFVPLDANAEVPWYVRNKYLLEGSQATLLAVTVDEQNDRAQSTIHAISVGDCCMFVFAADSEVRTFPVETSADFGVTPQLLCNHPQPSVTYSFCETTLRPGEFALVCTDAMGKWILECLECGQSRQILEPLVQWLALEPSEEMDTELVETDAEASTAGEDDGQPQNDVAATEQEEDTNEKNPSLDSADAQKESDITNSSTDLSSPDQDDGQDVPVDESLGEESKEAASSESRGRMRWLPSFLQRFVKPNAPAEETPAESLPAEEDATDSDESVDDAATNSLESDDTSSSKTSAEGLPNSEQRSLQPDAPARVELETTTEPEATTDSESRCALSYEAFVDAHRAPDAQPRMRNDDATLVLCVRTENGDGQSEALAILREHLARCTGNGLAVRPLVPTPAGEDAEPATESIPLDDNG